MLLYRKLLRDYCMTSLFVAFIQFVYTVHRVDLYLTCVRSLTKVSVDTGSSFVFVVSRYSLSISSQTEPASPPRNMSCYVKGSNVVVRWDEPIKPNGHVVKYHLWWLTVERKIEQKEMDVNVVGMDLKFTVTNVMRSKQFFVNISAGNSAGTGPTGHCIVDTSVIPSGKIKISWKRMRKEWTKFEYWVNVFFFILVQDTNEKVEIKRNTNDIKNGIVIGCLVSCLLLVLLLVFIYWSR